MNYDYTGQQLVAPAHENCHRDGGDGLLKTT